MNTSAKKLLILLATYLVGVIQGIMFWGVHCK